MLEYGDGTPKIPLIWVHTLMSLVLLFHFAPPRSSYGLDGHRSRTLHKLQEFGVHPDTLHYSSFEEPNTVYCIFQVDFEFSRLRAGYQPAIVAALCGKHCCRCSQATFESHGSVQKTQKDRVRGCRTIAEKLGIA